jgi:hypothetical protein
MDRHQLAEQIYAHMGNQMNTRLTAQERAANACCAYDCADAFLTEKMAQQQKDKKPVEAPKE